jgi:hypothetical protein
VVCELLLGSAIADAIAVDGGSGGDGGTGLNNGAGGYSGSIGQALLVANANKVLSSIGPSTTVVGPTGRVGGAGPSGRIDL